MTRQKQLRTRLPSNVLEINEPREVGIEDVHLDKITLIRHGKVLQAIKKL